LLLQNLLAAQEEQNAEAFTEAVSCSHVKSDIKESFKYHALLIQRCVFLTEAALELMLWSSL